MVYSKPTHLLCIGSQDRRPKSGGSQIRDHACVERGALCLHVWASAARRYQQILHQIQYLEPLINPAGTKRSMRVVTRMVSRSSNRRRGLIILTILGNDETRVNTAVRTRSKWIVSIEVCKIQGWDSPIRPTQIKKGDPRAFQQLVDGLVVSLLHLHVLEHSGDSVGAD